jgi:large subunit ribosomal protein L21
MYAVIKTGGKQYRVAPDEVHTIEKVAGDAGAKVEFTEVLMVAGTGEAKVGKPTIAGAKVVAEVVEQGRARRSRLQEAPAQKIAAQARSPPAPDDRAHQGNCRRLTPSSLGTSTGTRKQAAHRATAATRGPAAGVKKYGGGVWPAISRCAARHQHIPPQRRHGTDHAPHQGRQRPVATKRNGRVYVSIKPARRRPPSAMGLDPSLSEPRKARV